jgi:hypothetical protein
MNTFGQLGHPQMSNSDEFIAFDDVPAVDLGNRTVLDLSAGDSHVCVALQPDTTSNTVLCWGLNSNGQLGTGNRTSTISLAGFARSCSPRPTSAPTTSTTALTSTSDAGVDHNKRHVVAGVVVDDAGQHVVDAVADVVRSAATDAGVHAADGCRAADGRRGCARVCRRAAHVCADVCWRRVLLGQQRRFAARRAVADNGQDRAVGLGSHQAAVAGGSSRCGDRARVDVCAARRRACAVRRSGGRGRARCTILHLPHIDLEQPSERHDESDVYI